MFKGLKKVVKGGISTVAEKGTDLASNVVNDADLRPKVFKEKLTEGAKNTFKEGHQFVSEGGEELKSKEKTKIFSHDESLVGA